MELEDLMRERHIGEYLAQETPEERAIQDQLVGLVMWEFIFSDVFCYRDTVERTHGIRFEVRPKEKGHNVPHCHDSYQGQEISISLITVRFWKAIYRNPSSALRWTGLGEIYPSYRHTGISTMCWKYR